jgi:hypothetical protein
MCSFIPSCIALRLLLFSFFVAVVNSDLFPYGFDSNVPCMHCFESRLGTLFNVSPSIIMKIDDTCGITSKVNSLTTRKCGFIYEPI